MHVKRVVCCVLILVTAKVLSAQVSTDGINYVNTYKALAMAEESRAGVPAAIILAQGIHESEAGTSEQAKDPTIISGSNAKTTGRAKSSIMTTTAGENVFAAMPTAEDSYRDHSEFLRRSTRYAFLFDLDPSDYEGWAYGLHKAGYATNIRYSQILIKLIRDYNLQQYTLIAIGKMKPGDEVVLSVPGAPPAITLPRFRGASGRVRGGGWRQFNRADARLRGLTTPPQPDCHLSAGRVP